MAKKNYAQERMMAQKQKEFEKQIKRIRIFPLIALFLSAVTLLLFLLDWAAVYNADMSGNEVRISGFNCLFAALGGNYSKASAALGDMAVPFNYYAGSQVRVLSVLTIFAFLAVLANLIVRLVAGITNKKGASVISLAISAVEVGLFVACFAVALSIENAEILSGYCGGNPACSIKSQAILPGVLAALSACLPAISIAGYQKAKKILE